MKKSALVLSLVLLLTLLLTSCSGQIKFEGLYNTTYEDTSTILSDASLISELQDLVPQTTIGILSSFSTFTPEEGETKYAIFNASTGKVVYSLTAEAVDATVYTSAVLGECNGIPYIVETVTTTSTTSGETSVAYKLYDTTGALFAQKEGRAPSVTALANRLFAIEGKVCAYANGKFTTLFDLGMKSIPQCDILTDKYNYVQENEGVLVYDQQFNLVAVVEGNSAAVDSDFHVLADGNIYVRNVYALPEDAKEYDLLDGSDKYQVENYIFRVENQSRTDVELTYMIEYVASDYTIPDLAAVVTEGKIENLAVVYPITDKRVMTNESDMMVVNLGNDLSIKGEIAHVVPGQGENMPHLVADNRFVVYDMSGKQYLLNETGEILGEISDDLSDLYGDALDGMFVDSLGNVYDTDLKLVFNLYDTEKQLLPAMDVNNNTVSDRLYASAETVDGYYDPDTGDWVDSVTYYDLYMLTKTGYVHLGLDPKSLLNYSAVGDAIMVSYTKGEGINAHAETAIFNEKGEKIFTQSHASVEVGSDYYICTIHDVETTAGGLLITVEANGSLWADDLPFQYKTYFCPSVAATADVVTDAESA